MADKITTASAAWLTDPTVFAVNRTPAHSNHVTFSHIPAIGEPSDLKQSLDGEWRVEMVQASDIDLEEEPFAAEDFDDSAFGRIDVPSHLQNAGYMNHKYVNIQYPWDGHENPQEPNVPETNHVALYRRTFTVAERLDTARQNGGTVSITFHGMATAIYVWVNGVFVGYGEDGYTPNEFDITEALHDGENVVAVACYEYASASWLEDQDYWRLHGLFRSVELAAQPHVHIEDMKVEADWNPETATGSLDALLAVRNAKNAATVSATLKDLSGNVVWETALAASDETGIVSGSLDVKPWSAESPALYELQVVVIGHDGAIVETATQRVGFRRFRIEDGIMKLNGKRVVFKGADRHEFDAKRGRAITRQDMIDDITFCKRHNGTADELPGTEAAPLGGGVVDDVAQQRVDEDLRDADDHHEAGDDADKLSRQRLVDAGEQAAGHVHNKVRAHSVVEGGLAEVTACVGDTLAELALADSTVRGCCVAHFFFSSKMVWS